MAKTKKSANIEINAAGNKVFKATPDNIVTVYYCKARLKDGVPVRTYQGEGSNRTAVDSHGVRYRKVDALMELGNDHTLAKASGARCIMNITDGFVEILDEEVKAAGHE